jgi:hypothetical protein
MLLDIPLNVLCMPVLCDYLFSYDQVLTMIVL